MFTTIAQMPNTYLRDYEGQCNIEDYDKVIHVISERSLKDKAIQLNPAYYDRGRAKY